MAVASIVVQQPSPKMDEGQYNKAITAERGIIDALKLKLAEIADKISEKSGGREDYQAQRDEIRAEIGLLNKNIATLENERREMSEQESRVLDHERNGKTKLENMQKTTTYRTVADIEARLKDLEFTVMTTAMSLKDERVIKQESERLRKLIPEVRVMESLARQVASDAAAASSAAAVQSAANADKRTALRDELRALRDKRDSYRVQLQMLEAKRANTLAPLRDFFEQRDAIRSQIAEHNTILNDMIKEQKAKTLEVKADQARKRQSRVEIERFDRQVKMLEQDKKSLRTAISNSSVQETDWATTTSQQMRDYLLHEIDVYDKAQSKLQDSEKAPGTTGSSEGNPTSPERVQLDNTTYVVHRKRVEEVVVVNKRKNRSVKPATVSCYLNHSLASLKELKSLDVSIPKTIEEARKTVQELDAIIERQREKLQANADVKTKKQAELAKRLEALLSREKDILAKAPQGWKPSAPQQTTVS